MRKSLLVLTVLPLLAGVAPAEAATRVRGCVSTASVTFSPPLTPAIQNGTVTFAYAPTCAVAYTDGVTGISSYTGSISYAYFGSCVTALVTNSDTTAVLVGGTAGTFVTTGARVAVNEWVLVTTNPCAEASAIGVSVAAEVIP